MKKTGVLVIGHGSSNQSWLELVDSAIDRVNLPVPVVSSFLEMVEGRTIEDGIRQLEQRGIERIIAVPLFVASGSTHIDEISYLLGLGEMDPPEEGLEPIATEAEIVFCAPMDDHPLIEAIVLERARELSRNPAEEVVLLVGHGADEGENHVKWETILQSLSVAVQHDGGFKKVTYGTMHPDNLRARAEEAISQGRTIVVPLFLSEGYFTKKVIPSYLTDLQYEYSGKAYLPHPNVTKWIEDVVQEAIDSLN